MTSMWRAGILLTCATLLGAGCGKRSGAGGAVVARVGDRVITKAYFEDRLTKMDRAFLPDTLDLAGKRKFLDFIINKEVMAKKAEELKYADTPLIVANVKDMEESLTRNAAVEQLCKGKIEPSEAEIKDFYARQKSEVFVQHILVKERAQAEDLYKRLQSGANFDSLAKQFSVARQDARSGEPLPLEERINFGWIRFGAAMPPVEQAVFALQEKQISPPVQTAYGWHLFRAVSRREVKSQDIGELTDRITTQIKLRKKREIVENYYEGILKDHRFKWEEPAANLAYDKFPPDVGPDQRPDPAKEIKPILAFTADERQRLLFEVDGKKYTLGNFSDKYDSTNWFERPKRNTGVTGVRYWVRDNWLSGLQLERARKDRVQELPEVADNVRLRREQMMVAALHQNLVSTQAPEPTEAQIQEFFAKHAAVYVRKEMRRANLIFSPQEKVVRQAYSEVQKGAPFVEVAIRFNERATKPEHVQTPDFSRGMSQFAEIADSTFALREGQYTVPFKTTQGWVSLQVARIQPSAPLQLGEIKEQVVADYKSQWSEEKLNELLAQWKKEMKISIDDKVLAKAEVRRKDVVVPGAPAAAAVPGVKSAPGSAP